MHIFLGCKTIFLWQVSREMNKISSEKKSMLILSVGFGLVYLGMNGIVQHSVLCRSLGFRTCQSFSVKVLGIDCSAGPVVIHSNSIGSLGAYSMGLSYFVYSIANFFVPIFLIIFPDESFGLKLSALEYPYSVKSLEWVDHFQSLFVHFCLCDSLVVPGVGGNSWHHICCMKEKTMC